MRNRIERDACRENENKRAQIFPRVALSFPRPVYGKRQDESVTRPRQEKNIEKSETTHAVYLHRINSIEHVFSATTLRKLPSSSGYSSFVPQQANYRHNPFILIGRINICNRTITEYNTLDSLFCYLLPFTASCFSGNRESFQRKSGNRILFPDA